MKNNKIITSLLTLSLGSMSVFASQEICKNNDLTVSIEQGTKLSQTLMNIADTCKYTVVYTDEDTAKTVDTTSLYSINMFDKNVDDMLDILLHNNNLHYSIENNVVTVSKVITKTFRVDFIDMVRTGSSNAQISISAASAGGTGGGSGGAGGAGGGSGGGTGDSGASIETQEEVDFWSKLEENISNIVVRPEDKEKIEVKPIINRKSGLVTVSGTYKQLQRVQSYLDTLLETVQKQVLIDVKVIAVDLNRDEQTGIDWSKFGLGLNYNTESGNVKRDNVNVNGENIYTATLNPANDLVNAGLDVTETVQNFAFNMEGMISFLNEYGDSKTMASPKVLALNNQPTLISVGDNINYLIKSASSTATAGGAVGGESEIPSSLFVGVLLDITPHIDEHNRITLKINPSISELKYAEDGVRQTVARNLPPDTTTRRISTVVNMGNNETFVLGGLINQRMGDNSNNVDYLGDIPILGKLFSSEQTLVQNTELVFIINAKIIDKNKPLTMQENGFKRSSEIYSAKTGDLIMMSKEENKEQKEKNKKSVSKTEKKEENKSIKIKINKNSPFYDFE